MAVETDLEIAETILREMNCDTSDWAIAMRKGGWNMVYVIEDKSGGIHNPTYAIQILQQSILSFDPTWELISGAAIMDERYSYLE